MTEHEQKMESLAADVLRLSRNTLLVNLRFLDAALSRMELQSVGEITLATDGQWLCYGPKHVLQSYKQEREIPVRAYLHAVLHCVYQHMFIHTLLDRSAWDLACDIAVEYTISQLNLQAAATQLSSRQTEVFEKLKKEIKLLTAEKIYRYYLDQQLPPKKMAELRGLFYADDHELWYMRPEEKAALGIGSAEGTGDGDGEADGNGSSSSAPTITALESDWQGVAQRMQVDMETFSKLQGDRAGGLMQNLSEVNREKYDYAGFLKKFAVRGEVMKINDDEFDYIFYTYGLQRYRNMPLIEPLEYKDVQRIREFVIAIDTSGSVMGETVQRFVQKTYNILQSTESFFSRINLHIIQCDTEIQEDMKITSREEFDEYLKTMKIRGLGGTDFRPVFRYVDKLVQEKEFRNLRGLIYFTDGFGTFPEKMPDYQTAFVFLAEEYNNPDVPPWAIKLVLQTDEI